MSKIEEPQPTLAEWQQLYALMADIKKLAPWQFMTEDMIFGVKNPETSEIGFVSVMGQLGEHLSVAVYLGVESLLTFWAVHTEQLEPNMILTTTHLQASFEDREILYKEDRQIIKQLGLKFRGAMAWPMFRSYRPGFLPWFINQAEARFLTHVLAQTLDVAQRLQADETLLNVEDEWTYLVRVPAIRDDDIVWHDEQLRLPPSHLREINIFMNPTMLDYARHMPKSRQSLEVDFFMIPSPIQPEMGTRPFFGHMLMVVESKSGFVLGGPILSPEPGYYEMLGKVAVELLTILIKGSHLPKTISVRSPMVYDLLSPLCQELGILLKSKSRLRMLEEAQDALFSYLKRGMM